MSCLDKVDSVIPGLKEDAPTRERLKPLFDPGWTDLDTSYS